MLQPDPNSRLNIADIYAHPWLNGYTATEDDIRHEFNNRELKNEEERK